MNPRSRYIIQHRRIAKKIQKPDLCPLCLKSPPNDLANVSGEYNYDDVEDWIYLCRHCHRFFDRHMFMSRLPKIDINICLDSRTKTENINPVKIK